jgi:hypothetical protein
MSLHNYLIHKLGSPETNNSNFFACCKTVFPCCMNIILYLQNRCAQKPLTIPLTICYTSRPTSTGHVAFRRL